ncbi:hypothetical protein BOTBODRAFT_499193 [Botryobasidium botryosum FD-172 SS1]|uniref:Uncharacterized protein n=1 Tax=Botryobasidium botryosum (strain FD-172 SS1) TaxID=930990 RepID=A0A067M642_BOTB1|nr:hypothetical protein BOTBODRAFT_499193 [Botryobasidium botryosum FD-172 SS1]
MRSPMVSCDPHKWDPILESLQRSRGPREPLGTLHERIIFEQEVPSCVEHCLIRTVIFGFWSNSLLILSLAGTSSMLWLGLAGEGNISPKIPRSEAEGGVCLCFG